MQLKRKICQAESKVVIQFNNLKAVTAAAKGLQLVAIDGSSVYL